jgi:hypothetical protein
MLNTTQRWVIFILFCLFTVACVGIECYFIYSMVANGFSNAKAVTAVLNGSILYGFGKIFLKMVSSTFLTRRLTPERLHQFASERCLVMENAYRSNLDEYTRRKNLVNHTLQFCENLLKGWIRGTHLEFCVFVDQDQPVLFGYFDSNHDTTARSMNAREHNPGYYVDNGYEVVKVLKNPSSQPKLIEDTQNRGSHYAFTSNQQRSQIRSSMLLCIDVTTPCVLVISSNEIKAFTVGDPEVVSIIRFVGEIIKFDLFENGFISRLRELKPQLFRTL